MESTPDIVVIGASAGGVQPLQQLSAALPRDLEAAVFVVLHTMPAAGSLLPQVLSRGALKAVPAEDRSLFEMGKIYVAPPDRHVQIYDGLLRVTRGPKENRHRPSIDVLFRSAAMAYGPRTIGVLLSGADDDGTAGFMAIKRRGGITIVQDPEDSEYPEMPASALNAVGPDFKRPVAEIGPVVARLVKGETRKNENKSISEPVDKSLEHDQAAPEDVRHSGTPSAFTRPDCIMEAESESVERALWSAVRTLEESAALSRRIARKTRMLREELNRKAAEREEHARIIRALLVQGEL